MSIYIGIDLGTTNSAIATFDGECVRVWKTKDQQDVTPSCIFVDKKGKRFYGAKAYKAIGRFEERVARQFKRFMGTSTKIEYAGVTMTPEECSAEILRELMRCLPEEIVNAEDKATVITVPAAFDQMQNEATKQAAAMAKIGKVAVMQEPVAAIMSVMQSKKDNNGTFLIFDMGGGTLDVAIASAMRGKIDVIAHGGIAMCGGADIDTRIVDNYVIPWLLEESEYNLPRQLRGNKKYEKLLSRARFAAEEAKIELSSCEEATIYGALGSDVCDEDGEEIELDIPLDRSGLNKIMEDLVNEAIECARDTIKKCGIPASDFSRIVFIGGPTNYKPLRDKVTRELGIRSEGLEVNPMTAVAEGAAIYAETIDWSTAQHEHKETHGAITSAGDLGLKFRFEARTTKPQARLGVKLREEVEDYQLQVKSVDTGWDSGLLPLENGKMLTLPLAKMGDNTFEIYVYDNYGRKVRLEEDTIVITQTLASVGSILASHTLSVEVRDSNLTDSVGLDPLVRKGDKLPVKGTKVYKATEKIKSGSSDALVIKLWQGELATLKDNRFVGCMKIDGSDLEEYGSVKAGDEITFDYTINEAGSINVTLTIERLGLTQNSTRNFYSTQEAQLDMNSEDTIQSIVAEGELLEQRVDDMDVEDERLEKVRKIASQAQELGDSGSIDPERVKKNSDNILKAKQLLDEVRTENLTDMRHRELAHLREHYEENVEQFASAVDKEEMEHMFTSCEKLIGRKDKSFESTVSEIQARMFHIQFSKSPEYVVSWFKWFRSRSYLFPDKAKFNELVAEGLSAINKSEYAKLRKVIVGMFVSSRRTNAEAGDMSVLANIMRG